MEFMHYNFAHDEWENTTQALKSYLESPGQTQTTA